MIKERGEGSPNTRASMQTQVLYSQTCTLNSFGQLCSRRSLLTAKVDLAGRDPDKPQGLAGGCLDASCSSVFLWPQRAGGSHSEN